MTGGSSPPPKVVGRGGISRHGDTEVSHFLLLLPLRAPLLEHKLGRTRQTLPEGWGDVQAHVAALRTLPRDVSRIQESSVGPGSTPRGDPHRGSVWELYEEARV